jgi:hypothetical protein
MRPRRLALGTALVLGSAAMAQAADLPVPERFEYMRVCNAFGTNFHYIPGTDTCLHIGGEVRGEWHYVDGDVDVLFGGPKSDFNNWTSRARANIRLDARTQSGIGQIRTYIDFQATVGPANFVTLSNGDVGYSATEPELSIAVIEIDNGHGVFTAGHTSSFFDFWSSDTFGTRLDIDDNTTEQTLVAYTIGSEKLRGTLSIEDPASGRRRLNGADDHEGQELPDLVANLRTDQKWGSAQIMGVLRHTHDIDGDGVGYAVGAGFTFLLPGLGWTLGTQAGYADGALAYITNDPGGVGDFSGPDGDDSNEAWMVRAGLSGPLTKSVSAWLDGSFTHAETDGGGDEYDFWALVAGAAWEAAPGLTLGPEVAYNRIDGDDAGEDGDVYGAMWRVQSSF